MQSLRISFRHNERERGGSERERERGEREREESINEEGGQGSNNRIREQRERIKVSEREKGGGAEELFKTNFEQWVSNFILKEFQKTWQKIPSVK